MHGSTLVYIYIYISIQCSNRSGRFAGFKKLSGPAREDDKTRGIGSARLRAQTRKLEKTVARGPQTRKDEKTREIGFAPTGRSKSLLKHAFVITLRSRSLLERAFGITGRTKSLLGGASRAFLRSTCLLKGFEITPRPCSIVTMHPKSLAPRPPSSLEQENSRNGFAGLGRIPYNSRNQDSGRSKSRVEITVQKCWSRLHCSLCHFTLHSLLRAFMLGYPLVYIYIYI